MAESQQLTDPAAQSSTTPQVSQDVIVKCTKLTKVFRDFWFRNRVRAVDEVDLDVRRGEVFGLLGPNGSGKSTTIKMLLGLLYPTSGRIGVFGKRPDDVSIKHRIGYLPEESYLYRFLNARETLEYYGRLFHQSRTQRQGRIEKLLRMVGLEGVQRRPVGEYSKGMQRRIGLAQALINDPQLLVLDEPTTGLDPIGTKQIKDLILTLKQRGKTILLCSHLLADVEDVCDRVAVMYGGRVQRHGPVDELLTLQNMTTLQTESLDGETIKQIDELLTRRGKYIEKIEQPRQKLETLFLDIVHEALARGAVTSGATSGGQIADFLAGEGRAAHMPESIEAEQVLDELLGEREPIQEAAPQPVPPPPATTQPPPAEVGQDVIADLTAQTPVSNIDVSPQSIPPKPQPAEVDHSVIEELTSDVADATADEAEAQTASEQEAPDPMEAARPPEDHAEPTPAAEPPLETPSANEAGPDGERPDQGFLDALRDVPDYERDESDEQPSQGGSR